MSHPQSFTSRYDLVLLLALVPYFYGFSLTTALISISIGYILFVTKDYGEQMMASFFGKQISAPEEPKIKAFYFNFEDGLLTYTFMDNISVTLKYPYYSELKSYVKGYLKDGIYYYYADFSYEFKQKIDKKNFENLITNPDLHIYELHKIKKSWDKDN